MSKAETLTIETESYHALRDSWSHSQLETFIESPELFRGRHHATPPEYPRNKSTALDWGTVADSALTNPEGMDAVMEIIPEWALSANGARQGNNWKAFEAARPGKILLKQSETVEIVRAVRNCRAHPLAKRILDAPGEFQWTIKWLDDDTGLWLRARLDKPAYLPEGLILSDIKTSRNHRLPKFASDADKFGYFRQAAHYWDAVVELGEQPDAWINVAIGKADPQETEVYEMDPEDIEVGRSENRKYLRELAQRLQTNDWRPRSLYKVQQLKLPRYRFYQQLEEDEDE